jgi:cytochrome oxidase Cu insertion factor (SCO1/SenC/PrrC family)
VGAATNVALTSEVANASFVNQNGVPRTLAQLSGKTIFLVPFLTLCGDTCPFTTGNLLQLQARLTKDKAKNDVIVGISVDPYRDSVARLKAYSALIGAPFELWTPSGATTEPNGAAGTGDVNANLTTIEQFFGWTVSVVAEGSPAMTDWMKPYKKLTYDINHSDGFWVINAAQTVRFVSGNLPCFNGTIAKTLSKFMGQKSNIYKNVNEGGWTPAEAAGVLSWVTGVQLK